MTPVFTGSSRKDHYTKISDKQATWSWHPTNDKKQKTKCQ